MSGDFSPTHYDGTCGTPKVVQITSSGEIENKLLSNTIYSLELNQAYAYAYKIGITTISPIEQADLMGTLIRKHLAKMISNFAIKQMSRIPNT